MSLEEFREYLKNFIIKTHNIEKFIGLMKKILNALKKYLKIDLKHGNGTMANPKIQI